MTTNWSTALAQALRANDTSLADLVAQAETSALRDWLARADAGAAEKPSPAAYLDLSDLTGIEVEVLTGEVSPEDTLAVAMRSRGQVAPESVLSRAVQLLRVSRAVLRFEPDAGRSRALRDLQDRLRRPTTAQLARATGQRAAMMVRAELGLGMDPVLDLAEVVESLGIAVESSLDLPDGLHGLTSWTQVREGWIATIAINARDYWTVQRYSLAHEFCHVIHEDRPEALTTEIENEDVRISSDPTEARAEAFASNFLAPRAGLADFWSSSGLGEAPEAVAVAGTMWHWGLSRQAACYALENCSRVRWTAAETRDVMDAQVWQMVRDAGLEDDWSQMGATEGVFAPSVWLSEATAALFVGSRLPIESFAAVTRQPSDQALRQLVAVD